MMNRMYNQSSRMFVQSTRCHSQIRPIASSLSCSHYYNSRCSISTKKKNQEGRFHSTRQFHSLHFTFHKNANKFNSSCNNKCLSTSNNNSKVYPSASEAINTLLSPSVLSNASINMGGFGLGGIPETLIDAIANNTHATQLTIAGLTAGVDEFGLGILLAKEDKVKRVIASYVGENKVRRRTNICVHISIDSIFFIYINLKSHPFQYLFPFSLSPNSMYRILNPCSSMDN